MQLLVYQKFFLPQIKGNAIGTIFAVVGSNVTVAYIEEKMFLFYNRFIQKTLLTYFRS